MIKIIVRWDKVKIKYKLYVREAGNGVERSIGKED
jgi:hypothetical protein